MENDFVDVPDEDCVRIYIFDDLKFHVLQHLSHSLQVYASCPLIRSDSTHNAYLEAPTIEKTQKRIRTVEGISDQVVEDFDFILEKSGQSYYVLMTLSELVRKPIEEFSSFD